MHHSLLDGLFRNLASLISVAAPCPACLDMIYSAYIFYQFRLPIVIGNNYISFPILLNFIN